MKTNRKILTEIDRRIQRETDCETPDSAEYVSLLTALRFAVEGIDSASSRNPHLSFDGTLADIAQTLGVS